MKHFFTLFVFVYFSCLTWAVCPTGQAEVSIQITPDSYAAQETDWYLYDSDNTLLGSGSTGDLITCVPANECLRFLITDSYGDGLTTSSFTGNYSVYYNGTLVQTASNFGYDDEFNFGNCPAGMSCYLPLDINSVGSYTAPFNNSWYAFTPDTTGNYLIRTCDATCNTTIWVYDHCDNLAWGANQEATMAYSVNGCSSNNALAKLTVSLVKDHIYYIRIGGDATCDNLTVPWDMEYLGPISGCMDINACNYNPVALISEPGACLYSPDANCPEGPDLKIVQSDIVSSLSVTTQTYNSSCYVNEGCLSGYGTRKLLRFTTHIKNIGTQDYYVGAPSANSDQWEWDECHGHWHYEGYAEYVLYTLDGIEMPIGFKNGFCVLDLECSDGGVAKFTCNNQGITAGCGDIYNSSLACQWIDITNVPSGIYTLVVRVNWDQSPDKLGHYELRYDNNWAQVCLNIQHTSTSATVSVVNNCSPYVDCAGQIYGSAQPDCEGTCNGLRKAGDLDVNYVYEANDVNTYLSNIAANTATLTPCTDLVADNEIDVYDAIMLNACIQENNGGTHPGGAGVEFCELPTMVLDNVNDTAWFGIGAINTNQKFVIVALQNPLAHLLGYQFTLQGLNITNVETIDPTAGYLPQITYNATTKRIIVSSPTETMTDRFSNPTPILKVSYSSLSGGEVKIGQVESVVNNNYEKIVGQCRPFVQGNNNVCNTGAYTYGVPSVTGTGFTWSINGGTILSGQGTNMVNVNWNGGTVGSLNVVQQ